MLHRLWIWSCCCSSWSSSHCSCSCSITFTFETFLTSQITSVLEHIASHIVQSPVWTFARSFWTAWYFDKTIVETQRMSDGILPSLLILTIEWKCFHYVLINVVQCNHACAWFLYGHCDQRYIRVVRFGMTKIASILKHSIWWWWWLLLANWVDDVVAAARNGWD